MPSTTVEIRGKDKTSKAFDKVRKSIGGLKKGVLAIGAAVAGASAAFGVWFNSMRDAADRVGKVSKQLNISAVSLQKLQHAADKSGLSSEQLNKALQKFSRTVGEAVHKEMPIAIKAFEMLGLSQEEVEVHSKNLDKLLFKVADRFKALGNSSKSATIASDLFGKSGIELLVFLREGRAGIQGFGREIEHMGGIISNKGVATAEQFNDRLSLLKKKFRDLFAPVIEVANNALAPFVKEAERAGMPLEKLQVAIQDEINVLVKQRDALGESKEATKGWFSWLSRGARDSGSITKASIQGQIDALSKQRAAVNEQVAVLKEQYLAEKDALEQSLKIQDAKKQQAEVEKILGENYVATNDALESQLNTYGTQLETFEELQLKKQEMLEQDITAHQEEMAMLEEFDQEYKKKVDDRIKKEKEDAAKKLKEDKQNAKDSLRVIESLSSGIKDESYEIFMAWKASAIANATIATYEAATKAYTVPYVGMALSGLIYGLGMANVAKIGATKYEKRQYGGPVERGGSYIVGEAGPELLTMGRNSSGYVTPNNQLSRPINVNINAIDAEGIDELLYERRGMLVGLINESLAQETRAEI